MTEFPNMPDFTRPACGSCSSRATTSPSNTSPSPTVSSSATSTSLDGMTYDPAVVLAVFVPGIPRPQGSKRPFRNQHSGRIAMVESSKHVKTWRDDIRAALINPHRPPFDGPVLAELEFRMPRPKGHYRTGRNAHLLRDTAPTYPTGKPDIDKLERAVLDAITSAGVWLDDAQAVEVHHRKVYAGQHDGLPGVHIGIRAL